MAAASVVRPPAQGGDLRKDAAEGRGIHLPLPLVGRGEGRRAGDGDADHRKVRRRRARRHRAPPRLAVRHQGRDQKAGRGDQRVLPLAVRHARGAHLLPRILRRGAVGQNLPAVRRGRGRPHPRQPLPPVRRRPRRRLRQGRPRGDVGRLCARLRRAAGGGREVCPATVRVSERPLLFPRAPAGGGGRARARLHGRRGGRSDPAAGGRGKADRAGIRRGGGRLPARILQRRAAHHRAAGRALAGRAACAAGGRGGGDGVSGGEIRLRVRRAAEARHPAGRVRRRDGGHRRAGHGQDDGHQGHHRHFSQVENLLRAHRADRPRRQADERDLRAGGQDRPPSAGNDL